VYSLFPSIYSPHKKFHERLWESFLVHHSLLSIFTDHNIQSRLLNAFELMTLWSFELFMVAFFYELQYPIIDCENFLTMETCIEKRTLMDSSQSLCEWNSLNKISCNNNEINEPVETVILVTILIVVLATPIILIISYTFDVLLRVPTYKDIDIIKGLKHDTTFLFINISSIRRWICGIKKSTILPIVDIGDIKGNSFYSDDDNSIEIRGSSTVDSHGRLVIDQSHKNMKRKTQFLDKILIVPDTISDNRQALFSDKRDEKYYKLYQKEFELNKSSILFNIDNEYNDNLLLKIFNSLESDIIKYRRLIISDNIKSIQLPYSSLYNRINNSNEYLQASSSQELLLLLFDDAWGIRKVNDSNTDENDNYEIFWWNKDKLLKLITIALQQSIKMNKILNQSVSASSGIALMQLFTSDCLGSNSIYSTLFQVKATREFSAGRCVSIEVKSFVIL
jgi:hypothetical protein